MSLLKVLRNPATLLLFILAATQAQATPIPIEFCLRALSGAATESAEEWARSNAILREYFQDNAGQSLRRISLEDAAILTRHFGIREMPDMLAESPRRRLKLLRSALEEIAKTPRLVLDAIETAGRSLDLVMDNITNHPETADLKGKMVTKYREPAPYEEVAGISSKTSIVAANKIHRGHGSQNIILHEHAHTFEKSMRARARGEQRFPLSHQGEFLALHAKANWHKNREWYEKNYPEEAFAETFARYFDSPRSRKRLLKEHPEIHEYYRKRFDPEYARLASALGPEIIAMLEKAGINTKGDELFLEAWKNTKWDIDKEWFLFSNPAEAFADAYQSFFGAHETNIHLAATRPYLWRYFHEQIAPK